MHMCADMLVDVLQSSALGAQSSGMLEAEGAGESEAAPPSLAAPRKRLGAAARRRPRHYSSDSDSDEDDEDWEEEDDAVRALLCIVAVSSQVSLSGECNHNASALPHSLVGTPGLSASCCTGLGGGLHGVLSHRGSQVMVHNFIF